MSVRNCDQTMNEIKKIEDKVMLIFLFLKSLKLDEDEEMSSVTLYAVTGT